MKKLLLGAVSLAALCAPAYAQTWQDPRYPADQYSQYPNAPYTDMQAQNAPVDNYVEPMPIGQTAPAAGRSSSYTDDVLFSGNVGVVTDYRNRGVSRSDGPALQGQAKLNYNGVYGGVSGSTVDMNIDDDANIEAQFFMGYKTKFDDIDVDGRLSYVAYPGGDNDDMDYFEFAITGGYDFDVFYGSVTWAISPNYINDSGVTLYYGGDLSAPIPLGGLDLTAKAHLGFQFIGDDDKYVDDGAMDWGLGVSYTEPSYGLDLGLGVVGTNLDDDECAEDCGSQFMLSAGKSFGW